MIDKIDKRDRAEQFRVRLKRAIERSQSTQSSLARAAGVDRSTISQLLVDDGARLPNAHLVGACASALGVSSDWLLGLSDRPESAADLVAMSLSVTKAPRTLVDEQIFAWHREAEGYKIRYVPATLPDMLKTRDMLEWEYTPHLGRTAEQAINAAQDRLTWMQASRSDFEMALPLHELTSFASGTGYYAGLPEAVRSAQIAHWIHMAKALYPRLRIYAFDARRVYSAPITLFGPLLAVIYIGQNYITFRDTERIQAFTAHFDALVREAEVSARDLSTHLERLMAGAGTPPAPGTDQ
ncbi:MAG: helix-turn-helix domain-containing protein [Rhodobacteraceae bacterium]|nr:helix-turn-helix domain-containing protein [Paracoccaceae bacterium]